MEPTSTNSPDTSALESLPTSPSGLGWSDTVELLATRYRQGGRRHFTIAVPIGSVGSIVEPPDPNQPLPGNRRVEPKRAEKFAEYLRTRPRWVSPAVIGRVEAEHVQEEIVADLGNGIAIVKLRLPRWLLAKILDGQHRVLGAVSAVKTTRNRISDLSSSVRAAQEQGNREATAVLEAELDAERRILARLTSEAITVELALVGNGESGQLFVDINANAKGVNPDLITVLDQSKVVNRIANAVIGKHRLFIGRVEFGHARMSPRNPNLIGAKSVADIVSGVLIGTGRVGRRVEDALARNEDGAIVRVTRFLDVLVTTPGLADVAAGELDPALLREDPHLALLGSATFLRVLAMVWHHTVDTPTAEGMQLDATEFGDALAKAAADGWFAVPVNPGHPLWDSAAFAPDANAPMARQGAIGSLVSFLIPQLKGLVTA